MAVGSSRLGSRQRYAHSTATSRRMNALVQCPSFCPLIAGACCADNRHSPVHCSVAGPCDLPHPLGGRHRAIPSMAARVQHAVPLHLAHRRAPHRVLHMAGMPIYCMPMYCTVCRTALHCHLHALSLSSLACDPCTVSAPVTFCLWSITGQCCAGNTLSMARLA